MWFAKFQTNSSSITWYEVSYNIPVFYKNYTDLNSLASALGESMNIYIPANAGQIEVETGSALTMRPIGLSVYQADTETSDLPISPSAQGRLVYIFTSNGYGVVFYMKRNKSTIYFNNCENKTWTGWHSIEAV